MIEPPRIYLAGPDVFLPDPIGAGQRLKALCQRHGLVGLFPLDNELEPVVEESHQDFAHRIRAANLDLIRSAAAIIANVSPFRGPNADDGTAYEMGYAAALGLPVFPYSDVGGTLLERTRARLALQPDGANFRDAKDWLVEDFHLPVNLMLVDPLVSPVHPDAESALRAAARHLRSIGSGA